MPGLLIVGSDQVWSLERVYLKYIRQSGVPVELFAAQNLFYAYHQRSLWNKIKLKLGAPGIYRAINAQLRRAVEENKPGVVWVFKGMEIWPQTLEWIRSRGIKLVNYNPDNPFIFTGSGSGNRYVTDSIRLFDIHFTYNLQVKKRLEEEYYMRTAFLPFGFDLEDGLFERYGEEPEILRTCFVGNPDKQRLGIIMELAEAGLEIDLYGNDWEKFARHPLLKIFPPVYGNDFWKIIRRYRVQLNLMRIHNEDSHNMRSFEVPGIGGIMLAPDTTEHRMFFTDGKEASLFADTKDCLARARMLLALGKEEADTIRSAARERSIGGGYTYKQRATSAMELMEKLYAEAGHRPF
jgi:spore maturation protein CgeB